MSERVPADNGRGMYLLYLVLNALWISGLIGLIGGAIGLTTGTIALAAGAAAFLINRKTDRVVRKLTNEDRDARLRG